MKKPTRAYKVGFTDGQKGEHNNQYTEGSTRYIDYETGFAEGETS